MAARARVLLLASGLSAVLGLALAGHGGYLYVKAIVAQHLLELAWARTLTTGTPEHAWPWADSQPIAKIWLSKREPFIVLSNTDGSSLAFAPGHLPHSAKPGYPGHSVISAHRDTHFRGLQGLTVGKRLLLQRQDGELVTYQVQSTEVLHNERQRLRHLDTEEAWITLVTCYPFTAVRPGGPWRFLLHARAVPTVGTVIQSSGGR